MNKEFRDKLSFIKKFESSIPSDLKKKQFQSDDSLSYSDDVLPFDLYKETRGNIERIADQINQSFSFEVYDGCAVLMRRLIEMLLILSYKNHNIENEIRDNDGDYFYVTKLSKMAKNNRVLDLSRNCKKYLGELIEKGHLSAHSPFYNAIRPDIQKVQHKFRQVIEELFYKAGILN